MSAFLEDLKARNLPPVIPEGTVDWNDYRAKIIDLFAREEYGYLPPAPPKVNAETISSDKEAWAGKAEHRNVSLSFDTPGGKFAFPVDMVLPAKGDKCPLIVYISFSPYPCGRYGPIEEIVDMGYALAVMDYNSVSKDTNDDFSSGLAAMYERGGDDGSMWGKISMWAWAASRVMDYALTLDKIDKDRIYCVGHSRLGKTALWCAVQDERFAGAGVNNSGCSGMSVTRNKQGERVADIVKTFPYWFCKNYHKYAGRESEMPFEQSMLAALMAPRLLAASEAEKDIWADPNSAYMSLYEADKAYKLLGVPGLGGPAEFPKVGTRLSEGRIGYNLRTGTHYMSRDDWKFYIAFFDKHRS